APPRRHRSAALSASWLTIALSTGPGMPSEQPTTTAVGSSAVGGVVASERDEGCVRLGGALATAHVRQRLRGDGHDLAQLERLRLQTRTPHRATLSRDRGSIQRNRTAPWRNDGAMQPTHAQ